MLQSLLLLIRSYSSVLRIVDRWHFPVGSLVFAPTPPNMLSSIVRRTERHLLFRSISSVVDSGSVKCIYDLWTNYSRLVNLPLERNGTIAFT